MLIGNRAGAWQERYKHVTGRGQMISECSRMASTNLLLFHREGGTTVGVPAWTLLAPVARELQGCGTMDTGARATLGQASRGCS